MARATSLEKSHETIRLHPPYPQEKSRETIWPHPPVSVEKIPRNHWATSPRILRKNPGKPLSCIPAFRHYQNAQGL